MSAWKPRRILICVEGITAPWNLNPIQLLIINVLYWDYSSSISYKYLIALFSKVCPDVWCMIIINWWLFHSQKSPIVCEHWQFMSVEYEQNRSQLIKLKACYHDHSRKTNLFIFSHFQFIQCSMNNIIKHSRKYKTFAWWICYIEEKDNENKKYERKILHWISDTIGYNLHDVAWLIWHFCG